MPFQHDYNYAMFMECIGKISASIEESDISNFIILGDFNAAVDTAFESELLEFCTSYDLSIISDYEFYGRDSGQFTYVSDAHSTTSWLDHIICSHGINSKVTSMNILDKMPSSDHLPLQAEIDVDFNCAFNLIDVNTCPRDIVSYKWSQCTPDDLYPYCCSTYALFSDIYVTPCVKCNNPDCNLASHKSDIDCLYQKICDSLENASKHCIRSSKIDYYKEHIVPGFNEHVNTIARHEYIAWRSAGKPRFGGICLSMNQSRLRFKSALKFCQHNENQMRADALERSMMNNDMTEFWKDVKKNSNSNVSLATNVDGSVGNTEVAEMWKCHYKSLLNSVQNNEFKKSVLLDINQQHESFITITPFKILDALKSIKSGKSSGVDGISARTLCICS